MRERKGGMRTNPKIAFLMCFFLFLAGTFPFCFVLCCVVLCCVV
ncbi:protein kinase, putative, partial [Trypanosoma cruzi marinkellei]